ncbi:MAG: DsbA family oxidoreductase [Myxococcota bacterium]
MKSSKPIEVVLYQDVLCAWCLVAETRLAPLREEFRELVRWRVRPYPLRVRETPPTKRELEARAKEIHKARKEPEGARLSSVLWTSGDAPRSSLPALAALEAAKLQGVTAHAQLSRALRCAALEQGVNVARSDVLFELATHVGLDMTRFSAAFQSAETRRLILEEHRYASERGVKGVPTLVIGARWMISGLRSVGEYRELILSCLGKTGVTGEGSRERTLH